jgi:hypothetical protein
MLHVNALDFIMGMGFGAAAASFLLLLVSLWSRRNE